MKILIASDLHGSARYCRALLEAVRREEADHTKVRIAATVHGLLAGAERIYVQTAGNITQVEATEEIYGEEESEDA